MSGFGFELPGSQPTGGRARRSVRAQEKRRKTRRKRSFVAVLVGLAILVGAGGAVWYGVKPIIESFTAPDDYPGPGTGSVMVKIDPGASGRTIGRTLADKGVVLSAKAFAEVASKDPRAAKIQPGSYDMRLKMSSAGAIALLSDPKNRVVSEFTVPEGKRVKEIVDIIAKAGASSGITKKDLEAALADPAAIGLPSWAKTKKQGVLFPAEGFLFPSTYDIEPGDTAVDVLSRMVEKTLDELAEAGVPAGKEYLVLTEASIIQAEGGNATDFAKIARVFDNRTKKGMTFSLDSTISYMTQRFGVTTTPAERKIKSPYNTYLYKGWPVGPISNPGAEAIEAALAPAPGTWLFFVTVNPDTGETKFATTEAERVAITKEFQAWLAKNPQSKKK